MFLIFAFAVVLAVEGEGAAARDLAVAFRLLTYRVPFRSDGADGQDPARGDVHGCTSFFDTTGMSCRKIPAAEWTRRA